MPLTMMGRVRYGLEHVEPSESLRASGWRQVWRHPESGLLAMRDPVTGRWVVSDGWAIVDEGWSSSLRGAARRIERQVAALRQTEGSER